MLQNTVIVLISFIVRVFKQLSFIMNLTDRATKRMRVFKLTDFQTDLLCQSLTRIKRESEPKLTGQWKEDFNKMFNEVVGSYYPERIEK